MGTYGFSIGVMTTVFLCVINGVGLGLIIYILLVYYIYEPYVMFKGIGSL